MSETGKKEVSKQTVAYSPRSKLGTLLPEFPNVKDLNLPASLPEEKVSTPAGLLEWVGSLSQTHHTHTPHTHHTHTHHTHTHFYCKIVSLKVQGQKSESSWSVSCDKGSFPKQDVNSRGDGV